MPYSLDTSSLLEAWTRRYPPDMFPPVWEKMKELVDSGSIYISEEVLEEVKKKDDGLLEWIKQSARDGAFVVKHDAPIQQKVREILASHRKLIDTRRNRSGADPFVVAVACVKNLSVITQEEPTGSIDRPHIPDVCQAYGLKCLNFVSLLKAEKFVVR